jgi:ABC-type Fe3+-citrate transport system substrate-binding protein
MRNGVNSIENLRKFSKRVENHRLKLIELINKLNSEGRKIAALGASTKGNVLLQSCQLDSSKISMIGEINADKFGHFTPGTNIPIVSEEEVFEFNPDVLMILPWHFRATFLKKTEFFRSKGGRVLFPLPEIEFVE